MCSTSRPSSPQTLSVSVMVWGPEEKTIDQLFFEFASRFEEIARRENVVQIDPQVGLLIVCSGSINRFEKSRVKRITSSRKWNTVRVNLEIGEDIRCLSIAEKREQLCVLLETGFSRLEKWLTRYLGVQEDSFLGRIVPLALDDFRKIVLTLQCFMGSDVTIRILFPTRSTFLFSRSCQMQDGLERLPSPSTTS